MEKTNKQLMKATLNIFKALPIENDSEFNLSDSIMTKTFENGFIVDPRLVSEYGNTDKLLKIIKNEIGLNPNEINSSFHKSWNKIKLTSQKRLFAEQTMHYLTTYGQNRHIIDSEIVYIPSEALDIPKFDYENFKFVIIRGLTKTNLKEKTLEILNSGIALKKESIKDIVTILNYTKINSLELELINNKEVKIHLYSQLNIVPENQVEFLRLVVYTITQDSLLINNIGKINEIKDKLKVVDNILDEKQKELFFLEKFNLNKTSKLNKEYENEKLSYKINNLFEKYIEIHGEKKLAEIFNRFKKIFLAFKTESLLKSKINKISKLSKKYHKPLKEDFLNSITSKLKNNIKIDLEELKLELNKVNQFRKIRLAYSLKFRLENPRAIVYRIRNGKSFSTSLSRNENGLKFIKKVLNPKSNNLISKSYEQRLKEVLELVLKSISNKMEENVYGKKIYIPKNINYALPTTEKQFTGNFPSGTYISIPKDMIVGVHWENVENEQIDLDLSMINAEVGKIGWDSDHKTINESILFSGDMTNAPLPNGATELFYVKKQYENSMILALNYYNFRSQIAVPFKIVIGSKKNDDFGLNYMLNPNNVLTTVKSEISEKQKILGLLISNKKETRFYFAETNIGRKITSSSDSVTENARNYLMDYYKNSIELKDLLLSAGAEIVDEIKSCDIDLSMESLEKGSILNLIK